MVRIVASLSFRLRDTTECTASTGDGPASRTACITSFSNSVRGARTRASLWLRLDMARSVPLHHVTVKRILNQTDGPYGCRQRPNKPAAFRNLRGRNRRGRAQPTRVGTHVGA